MSSSVYQTAPKGAPMTKAELIEAVKREQNRVGEHMVYPRLEQFRKAELEARLAELRARD